MSPRQIRLGVAVAVLAGTGCQDPASNETGPAPPALTDVTVAANSLSTLSAVLTFQTQRADSARVSCSTGDGRDLESTPYYTVVDGAAKIVVLGLLPDTTYRCAVAAVGAGGAAVSDSIAHHTPELPATLAGVKLDITGTPSAPGYLITNFSGDSSAFALAFDSIGRVRWYRAFPAHPGEAALEVEQQANGDFTLYVGASTGWQPLTGAYYEVSPDGELVRSISAGAPYYTDPHELQLHVDGTTATAQLFGYDIRTVDLTALGGHANQLVAGHTLLRQSASGENEFFWNAWDHFTLDDWVFVPPNVGSYPTIDFDHPNSIAIDHDGNYVVSFAMLGEVTKIDAVSGQVLWRLGGRHNQFTIVDDPLNGFGFQHDVRVLDNGDLLFYDNGLVHSPPQSRAVEYRLDLQALTATLVWEYRHDPPIFTPFVGSVQRMGNGNTLVGFGAASVMTEVTPGGQVIWEGRLTGGQQPVPYFYRVRRIASLYHSEPP